NQQQQSHAIRASIQPRRTNLLRQIGTDDRQINSIDQPVAHKRGQDSRLELIQSQFSTTFLNEFLFDCLETHKCRNYFQPITLQSFSELMVIQFQLSVLDS